MQRKTLVDIQSSTRLFVLLFIVYSIVYMTKNCYSAAMASIVDAGAMTKSETGLIAAAFYFVYAIFQVVGGFAADKYSPSKLFLIGVFGAGVANILVYFFADNYIAMIIIWSLNAAIQFGIWPAVFKIITTQLAEVTRVKYMFYITIASVVGLLLSYGCAMFIHDWKNNFLISAISLFVSAVAFRFCYAKIEKNMIDFEPEEVEKEETPKVSVNILGITLKAGIPMLLIVAIIHSVMNLGIKALTPTMLMEKYESVTPAIGNGLNLFLILAVPIGMFLARHKVFTKINYVVTITVLFAISLPLSAIVAFVGKVPVLLLVAALVLIMVIMSAIGFFFSYISLAFNKFGRTGTLSGIFNAMASLGLVLANYVFAKMADVKGWEATTQAWAILMVIAFVLSLVSIPFWKKFLRDTEKM